MPTGSLPGFDDLANDHAFWGDVGDLGIGYASAGPGYRARHRRTTRSATRPAFATLDQTGRMRTADESFAARGMRSSWSELSTSAPDAPATKTTWASMTSVAPAAPSSAPTAWAWVGVKATTSQPRRNRRNWTCRPERLTWATTGAVVTGTNPSSSRARWSAHTARSWRSAAMNTPASYRKVTFVQPNRRSHERRGGELRPVRRRSRHHALPPIRQPLGGRHERAVPAEPRWSSTPRRSCPPRQPRRVPVRESQDQRLLRASAMGFHGACAKPYYDGRRLLGGRGSC
jgi:hypothetical protein